MDLATLFSDQLPFHTIVYHTKKSGMERVRKCVEILVVWSAFLSAKHSWTAKVARLRERQINRQEREDCSVPVTPFRSTKWVHWWVMEYSWNGQELEQQLQAGRWFWLKLTVWQPSQSMRLELWLVWDLSFGLGWSRDIQRPGNVKKSCVWRVWVCSRSPFFASVSLWSFVYICLFWLCFSSFMVICTYFIVLSMYIYRISFVRFMSFDFVWFLSQNSEFCISGNRDQVQGDSGRVAWKLGGGTRWTLGRCQPRRFEIYILYWQIEQICVNFFGFFGKPSRMSHWQRFWCRFIVPVQRL